MAYPRKTQIFLGGRRGKPIDSDMYMYTHIYICESAINISVCIYINIFNIGLHQKSFFSKLPKTEDWIRVCN